MSEQNLNYFTIRATREIFTEDPTGFILIFKVGLILHCIGISGPKKANEGPQTVVAARVLWSRGAKIPGNSNAVQRGHSCQSSGFSRAVQTLIASEMRYCARNIHLSKII